MAYLGSAFSQALSAAGTTVSGAYTRAVAAGNTLVAGFCVSPAVTSVADNAGNTYTLMATGTANGGFTTYIYAKSNCNAVTTSTTFTLTVSSSTNAACVVLAFSTGDGTKDASAVGAPGASTTPSIGPTGAVSQANEFLVAVYAGFAGGSVESFSATGAWTVGATATAVIGSGADIMFAYSEYQVLTNASGAYTGTGTLSVAPGANSAALVTFKDTIFDPFPVAYEHHPQNTLLRM